MPTSRLSFTPHLYHSVHCPSFAILYTVTAWYWSSSTATVMQACDMHLTSKFISDKVSQSNNDSMVRQGRLDTVLSEEGNTGYTPEKAVSDVAPGGLDGDRMLVYIPTPYFGHPLLNVSQAPQTFQDAPIIPSDIRKRMWFPIRSFGIGPLVTSEVPSDCTDRPLYCRAPTIPCRFTRPPEPRARRMKKDLFSDDATKQFPKVSFVFYGEPISVNMIEDTAETSTTLYVDHPMRYPSHVVGLSWYIRQSGQTFLVITHTDVMLRPGMSLSCSRRLGDFVLARRVCNLDGMFLFDALQRSAFGSNIFEKPRYVCVPREFVYCDVDDALSIDARAQELVRLRQCWCRIPEGFEARQLDRAYSEFGSPAEQISRFF